MKKFDKKIVQAGCVFTFSVCLCLLFYFIIFHSERFFGVGAKFISVFSPFIYGFCFAYILNPIMVFIEGKMIKPIYIKFHKSTRKYKRALVRGLSVLFTLIFFLLIMYALVILIIPQIWQSIQSIVNKLPEYYDSLYKWFDKILSNNPDISELVAPYFQNFGTTLKDNIIPLIQDKIPVVTDGVGSAITGIVGGVYSTITSIINIVFGLVISIFLLYGKETYAAQAKKITYALLREERANNLINNARFAHKTFGGFLSGKIVDSLVIGILSFVVLAIFRIPYAVLFSTIIGVTNIIPVFGPLIGAIPSAIILVMIDPMKALTFVIIVLVIQQLDGNFIGPFILGDSTGLSSFWVIFSITVFGGFFGFIGMFIGVPVFAVIYSAIRTFINERLKKKQLPDETTFYLQSDYHSDDEIINSGSEIKFVKKTFENIYVEGKGKQVKVNIEPSDRTKHNSNKNEKNKENK